MLFHWSGLEQSLTRVDLRNNGGRGSIDNFSFKEFHCRGEQKNGAIDGGV